MPEQIGLDRLNSLKVALSCCLNPIRMSSLNSLANKKSSNFDKVEVSKKDVYIDDLSNVDVKVDGRGLRIGAVYRTRSGH